MTVYFPRIKELFSLAVLSAFLMVTFYFLLEEKFVFVPLFLFASSLLGYFFYQVKGALPLLFLGLCVTFLENSEGVQLIELPFYILGVLMACYFSWSLLKCTLIIENTLDKLFLFLHLLIPFSIINGLLNGSSIYLAVGETTYYFALLLYFPLRKHLEHKEFRTILVCILTSIVLYVVLRNLLNYQQLLIQATLAWQAESARVSSNEVVLLAGLLVCVPSFAVMRKRKNQLVAFSLFIVLLIGLILTQSRGYWISLVFGIGCITLVINSRSKVRIIASLTCLMALSVLFAFIFLGDFLVVVTKGLLNRFNSIGSGTLDVSLLERVLESKVVLNKILDKPFLGYGLGHTFTKKVVFYQFYMDTSYVHNGYLAVWYKFGIIGLTLFLSIIYFVIRYSYSLIRVSENNIVYVICVSVFGIILSMCLVNNTSPQTLSFDGMLMFTLMASVISYLKTKSTTDASQAFS